MAVKEKVDLPKLPFIMPVSAIVTIHGLTPVPDPSPVQWDQQAPNRLILCGPKKRKHRNKHLFKVPSI